MAEKREEAKTKSRNTSEAEAMFKDRTFAELDEAVKVQVGRINVKQRGFKDYLRRLKEIPKLKAHFDELNDWYSDFPMLQAQFLAACVAYIKKLRRSKELGLTTKDAELAAAREQIEAEKARAAQEAAKLKAENKAQIETEIARSKASLAEAERRARAEIEQSKATAAREVENAKVEATRIIAEANAAADKKLEEYDAMLSNVKGAVGTATAELSEENDEDDLDLQGLSSSGSIDVEGGTRRKRRRRGRKSRR